MSLCRVRPVSTQQPPQGASPDRANKQTTGHVTTFLTPQNKFYFKRIFHCLTSEVRSCFFLFVLHYHGDFFKGCGTTQFPRTHTCTWQVHSEHLMCQHGGYAPAPSSQEAYILTRREVYRNHGAGLDGRRERGKGPAWKTTPHTANGQGPGQPSLLDVVFNTNGVSCSQFAF